MLLPALIRFLNRSLEPNLDQMKHGSVDNPASHRLEKFGVWKSIKISGQVCIHDFYMSAVDQPVNLTDCVQRAAVTPIGVLFRLEFGLEERGGHQYRRHHHTSVPDGGHSQRPLLLAVRLRYIQPPHRKLSIGSILQLMCPVL